MSELRSRPPADGWHGDARAVVLLTFDFDAEAPILAEGEHYAEDLSTMSHQAYGPKIGVPRILDLLARHEVEATFFVPGVTAERWPGPVEKILEAGHEVALHGHSHRRLPRLSQDEQVADLELGLGALARLGVSPKGYRAPYWQLTQTTLDALPQHGIRYDSSLMDDDRPYRIAISERDRRAARPLVAGRLGAVRLPARPGHRSAHREPARRCRDLERRARRYAADGLPLRSDVPPFPERPSFPHAGHRRLH